METQRKPGRPHKTDKYNFNSIINIKHLFINPIYTQQQSVKNWKKTHRQEVLQYHKQYNTDHDIVSKLGANCDSCNHYYSNISKHRATEKHKKNSLNQNNCTII